MATDPNSLFARAESAFRGGRFDAARADLTAVLRLAGEHPGVLHLLALTERRAGREGPSRDAFRRALRAAPRDPQINNNYANLLDAAGDSAAALDHYGRALAASPGFVDALVNRSVVLERLDRLAEALDDLDSAVRLAPANATAHAMRGTVLRRLDRLDEAAAAFERATALAPGHGVAQHGRARIAMERGEAAAAALYRRALELLPADREVILGLAESLDAEGDPEGRTMLGHVLEALPDWVAGHEMLARMRAEAGETDGFARSYDAALRALPAERALHQSHWQSLTRAGRHDAALAAIDAARATLGEDEAMFLTEAVIAAEAGQADRAEALLGRVAQTSDVQLARGRLALRTGDPAKAAALLEPLVEADPSGILAWAHLSLAWRLLGDSRQAWLCEQPGLYGFGDIGLSAAEIASVAEMARGLHRSRAHPIGQSLRGGTQTRGRLFSRLEPEIARLMDALRGAIDAHVAGLPPFDARHPLLRHRDARFDFDGAWSVRLTEGGFHVNHIHPRGVMSSACYLSLPPGTADAEARNGWLELGASPVELGLGLAAIATIEPKPGRLALFPSYLFHGTRPFSAGERLTVAFDLVPR